MRVLLALVVCGILLCGCTGVADEAFAKCLAQKGVKMYGASWCGHCQNQKGMFGESWKYMNYVECAAPDGTQAAICRGAGITVYPTWEFANGSRNEGELSVDELSAITGCELNQS